MTNKRRTQASRRPPSGRGKGSAVSRPAPPDSKRSEVETSTGRANENPNTAIKKHASGVNDRGQQLGELIDSLRQEFPKTFGELQANGILHATFNLAMTCKNEIEYLKAVFVRMVSLRSSLGTKEATPLERLLIDQVAACAVRVGILELLESSQSLGAMSTLQGRCLERRLHNARRLYFRAIESLARVRRLLKLPAIKIGVAAVSVTNNGSGQTTRRELVEVSAATGDRQLQ